MFSVKQDIELLETVTPATVTDDPRHWRDLLGLFYFFGVLLGREVKNDPVVYGASLSHKGRLWLLVVKVKVGDTLRVAYTMNDTPTGCVRAFGRAWLTGKVELREDKFA